MSGFNFEYSDLVMRVGKLLLFAALFVIVFLFSPPLNESIIPASVTSMLTGNTGNSAKNKPPTA
jgi:hypothetical protein